MEEEKIAKTKFVAITALTITFVFAFYMIAAIRVPQFFPTALLSGPAMNVQDNIDMLMIWAAAAVSIAGISLVIIAYVIFRISGLGGWVKRYSLIWIGALSIIAAIVLLAGGNRIAETAIVPYCDPENTPTSICHFEPAKSAEEVSEDTANSKPGVSGQGTDPKYINKSGWEFFRDHFNQSGYGVAIIRLKFTLNLFIQTAAICVLSLTIILAAARRVFTFIEAKMIREAYYISSLLLTMVVLSDALFFDFLLGAVGTAGAGSAYIGLQKGLLFYFAIVSTTTLILALAICSIIGKVPLLLTPQDADTTADAAVVSRMRDFFSNPGFATAFATFAPLMSAFINP